MIAAIAKFPVLGLVLGAFGFVLVYGGLARWRAALELRTRLLELFALATRRGLRLAPLVARAAEEQRGPARKGLRRVHARLERGEQLSDALAGARQLFPAHLTGAVRAAEGTAALAGALDAAAGEARSLEHGRHRVLVTALYPLLLGAFLVFVLLPLLRNFVERAGSDALRATLETPTALGGWLLVTVAGGLVGRALLTKVALLPGARLLATERLLRALAPHIAASAPLPDALRRAAPAAGHRAMAAGARDAAAELEAGLPVTDALDCIPLAPAAARRLAGGCDAPLLRLVAEECGRRRQARTERLLRWLHPLALLALGVLAALLFGGLLDAMARIREQVLW